MSFAHARVEFVRRRLSPYLAGALVMSLFMHHQCTSRLVATSYTWWMHVINCMYLLVLITY